MSDGKDEIDLQSQGLQGLMQLWTDDPLLCVAIVLTLASIALAFFERSGLLVGWLPKRKALAQAFSTPNAQNQIDIGLEWSERVRKIAQGQSPVMRGIDLAQNTLAHAFHPQILHPQTFQRALTYAVFYTLACLIVPWLFGGSGKLGSAQLLPESLEWYRRGLALLPLMPIGAYHYILRQRFDLIGLKDAVLKNICYFVAVAVAVGVAVAVADANTGVFACVFGFSFATVWASKQSGSYSTSGVVVVVASVALAGVFVGPGPNAGVVDLAFGFAVVLAFAAIMDNLRVKWYDSVRNVSALNRLLAGLQFLFFGILYLLVFSVFSPWLARNTNTKLSWVAADQESIALILFLGWLPLLNAGFDYLSVSLTQYFLQRMQRQQWSLAWWALDGLSSVALIVGLYWCVIGVLYLLQVLGWGVEPREVLQQFRDQPASSWLLWIAVTNVLPSLLHWALGLAGLLTDHLGGKAQHARDWASRVLAHQPLGALDAQSFADYLLLGYRWFSALLALSLLSWTVWLLAWSLPHSLHWLLD